MIDQIINGAMGMAYDIATRNANDKRQIRQQEKLNQLSMRDNKEMADYNQALALEMWDKTNYEAQTEQMRKAGLNVGLMYKGAGSGGTTSGAGTGQGVGTADAPKGGGEMGMGIMMTNQMALQKAQIENINADTNKKNVEADSISNVQNPNKNADTNLKGLQSELVKLDMEYNRIRNNIAKDTAPELVSQIQEATNQANLRTVQMMMDNKENAETIEQRIQQTNLKSVEQQLSIAGQKLGLQIGEANLTKIAEEVKSLITTRTQSWDKMDMMERETVVKEMMAKNSTTITEFKTATPEQIKQWTSLIGSIIGGVAEVKGLIK